MIYDDYEFHSPPDCIGAFHEQKPYGYCLHHNNGEKEKRFNKVSDWKMGSIVCIVLFLC